MRFVTETQIQGFTVLRVTIHAVESFYGSSILRRKNTNGTPIATLSLNHTSTLAEHIMLKIYATP